LNRLPEDGEIFYADFYADESGFEEHYSRGYGRSESGKSVYGEVPGTRRGRTRRGGTSAVGTIDNDNDFFAGFAFKGYMNGGLFAGRLERIFAPSLIRP
jgi:hypothetical protein